jgi:hypothetical protein
MNNSGHSRFPVRLLAAALAAALAAGCVSQQSRSSAPAPTPTPTGTPGTSQPGGTPPPAGGTSTGTQTAGVKQGGVTVPRGTESGTRDAGDRAGGDPAGQGTQKSGAPAKDPAGPQQAGATAGQKSDDEILAEALEELQRRNAGTSADGDVEKQSDKPGVATAPGQAQTDEEKVRALHQELSERFAKFDRTILSETEKVRQDDAASGNRGFSDRDPFQKGGDGTEETAAIDPETAGTPSPLPKSLPGADPGGSSSSDIPPDLVSAEGDDIIARQLREAAMKERDPELRAKLWDEYRKYKRGMK